MGRKIRRSTQICLSPSPSLYGMKDSPRGLCQLFASVRTEFGLTGLTRPKSDECFFVKFINNSKSRIQNIRPDLANIIEATAFVPENNRIYSDCPHATAILIIASYIDDNLAFRDCEALAAEFEIHCEVKFPMNAKGPYNWYLSVKNDRDPTTGAVSAHQHLYIDKLLRKWGIHQCNPLLTPFPQKANDIVKVLTKPVTIHDEKLHRIPSSGWHFLLSASTHLSRNILGSLSTKQIQDSTQPNSSSDSHETFTGATSKGARMSLYDGALKIAPAHTCQAQCMDMPTHPLPTQSHIDISQSDTSSCSTAPLSPGTRGELLESFLTQQKPSSTVSLVPLRKPVISAKCATS